jgi:hypothetical protein
MLAGLFILNIDLDILKQIYEEDLLHNMLSVKVNPKKFKGAKFAMDTFKL